MKFSALLSIYEKEKPEFLSQCLQSIIDQTQLPDEIIIVEDGPLTTHLYQELKKWQKVLPIKRVKLASNQGLGNALNYGLKHCKFELVARMDTDDICHPERFQKQLEVFSSKTLDICGSWVSEFDASCDIITSYRKAPENHDDILRFSRLKNPLNHPSVMYRKSAVLDVGGYDNVLFFEDYHLWLKLIDSGCKFYNIQEPLVSMRAGLGQLSRRGGLQYARHEVSFLKRCSREGLMSKKLAQKNVLIRFPIRVLPTRALGKLYKVMRNTDV
ncbi:MULTISPECIES: glycosyltransferase [Vibrio]|uniref:glycosyltransferase n=1 Tax=Vibrio TaxID=662 RepID=UPI0010BE0F31|nr:glycosyltransferase [Vibrio sp. F12]TKE74895.1 glycosyltransferase [Vibrio sp. F12]